MLTIESHTIVNGVTGSRISEFLSTCDDERYQAWWPGTHLQLHPLDPRSGPVRRGTVIVMDEFIGRRRIRLNAVVVDLVPGEKIVWQFVKGIRLPVRLTLRFTPGAGNTQIDHVITAGWTGIGRLLDPLWRLYFSRHLAEDVDAHVRTEFALLGDQLRGGGTVPAQ